MKSSQIIVGAVAVALSMGVSTVGAAVCQWVGGSGSWHDAQHWDVGLVPTSNHEVYFNYDNVTGPIEVTLDGTNTTNGTITVKSPTGSAEAFTKTVYLRGAGETNFLASEQGFEVEPNRKIVFDNLHLLFNEAQTSLKVRGKLTLVNGASFERIADGAVYSYPGHAGSRLFIDNSRFCPRVVEPAGQGGEIILRNNAFMQWERSWSESTVWPSLAVKFTSGTMLPSGWTPLYTPALFPKRPAATLIHRQGTTKFPTTGDTVARLGGSLWITNDTAHYLSFTNSVALYGRGKLFAGKMVVPTDYATTNWYDLSEVSVESSFNDKATSSVMTFFGDTLFTPILTRWASTWWTSGHSWFIGGTKTFDMLERFARANTKRRFSSLSRFYANCRSRTIFRNLNETTRSSVQLGTSHDTYGSLELGENCPVMFEQTDDFWLAPSFDGLKMGAGASIKTAGSQANYLAVFGEVDLDATAKIIRQTSARSAGGEPYTLLSSYDDDCTAPQFEMTTESEGFSVHRVGGSFFYGDGVYDPTTYHKSVGYWNGSEDGLWSNANNWGANTVPNGRTTCFMGFKNGEITVDVADLTCVRLQAETKGGVTSGPFILRGLPITVTGGDNQIVVSSQFPFIIANDLTYSGTADFCVSGKGVGSATPVVLRGTVGVANASFAPDGQVVVQGTVNAKDLHFRNWTGRASANYWPTKLRVERGGTVNIANQTTVNSATGTFFIAAGGAVNVTGDWKSTGCANEHCVRGALKISGALGGDATQAFYGEGVVQVATLDGGEGASVKIGEDLTLVPTAAGTTTMPIVMSQGDATLAPAAALTLAGGIRVDALGRTLTISNEHALAVTGALTGYDFDFVKTGAGRLVLAEASGLTNGYVTLAQGTLALTRPTTMGRLTAEAGATLELVANADGCVPTLTLDEELDLANLTIRVTGKPTDGAWQTLVRVGEDLKICGTPTVLTDKPASVRVIRLADDSMAVQFHPKRGLMLLAR